jgi:HrpA-like RNA helicase
MYLAEPVQDYVEAALVAVLQIHRTAPHDGDILVFLTGQEEIESLEATLKDCAKRCLNLSTMTPLSDVNRVDCFISLIMQCSRGIAALIDMHPLRRSRAPRAATRLCAEPARHAQGSISVAS